MLWAAAMPVAAGLQYLRPAWVPFLAPISAYLALCAGVIAHNHNHCPTFRSRLGNRLFGFWLSCFYGYPTFAWIPTHNQNHHKFVNRAGDATITWRYTNAHRIDVALTYFFVSSWFQSDPIKAYIGKAKASNPRLYRQIITEYVVWALVAVGTLTLAIGLHGWKTGLFVWSFATLVPAVFALWTIMLFNYEQHVHTDPWSEHNHSRTWTGGILNAMLFNNGFHAAHHEHPGMHWSELPKVHAELEPLIHPELVERNVIWYFVRSYLLGPFFPSVGTRQVGRAPFDPPPGESIDLACADVDLVESGENAPRVAAVV